MLETITIDIGTTFCYSAISFKNEEPQIFETNSGVRRTPICLLYTNEKIEYGQTAFQLIGVESLNYFHSILQILGKKIDDPLLKDSISKFPFKYNDETKIPFFFTRDLEVSAMIRPELVLSVILKSIINTLKEKYNEIPEAIGITIPAYYNWSQKKSLLNCCKISDIKPQLIPSPVAALLGAKLIEKNGIYLVLNIDTDSCCASVVNYYNSCFHILSSHCDLDVGLSQFDEFFSRSFFKKIKEIRYEDVSDPIRDAKAIRLALSNNTFWTAPIKMRSGETFQIYLNQATYDQEICQVLTLLHDFIINIIKESNVHLDQIENVLIVGEDAGNHMFTKSIQKLLKIDPYVPISPEETTAIGASIFMKNEHFQVVNSLSQSIGLSVGSTDKKSLFTMTVSREGEEICGKINPPFRFNGDGPIFINVIEGNGDYSNWHTLYSENIEFEGRAEVNFGIQVKDGSIKLNINGNQRVIEPASDFVISEQEIRRLSAEVESILEQGVDGIEEYLNVISKTRTYLQKMLKRRNLSSSEAMAITTATRKLIPKYRDQFNNQKNVDLKEINSKLNEFKKEIKELGIEIPKN